MVLVTKSSWRLPQTCTRKFLVDSESSCVVKSQSNSAKRRNRTNESSACRPVDSKPHAVLQTIPLSSSPGRLGPMSMVHQQLKLVQNLPLLGSQGRSKIQPPGSFQKHIPSRQQSRKGITEGVVAV